jgi:hypothetical protein
MTIRRLILLPTCTAVIFALTGCSSVNPNTISVTITTAPPAALPAGATASVAATVTNDSHHLGVDWTATCGTTGACGSFSPTHTASGASTTFTAPSDIPDGNTVSIIATSTRNPGKAASASTTVLFSNTVFDGNYVFEAAGLDVLSSGPFAGVTSIYQIAGVLTADGAGAITGGELTFSDQHFVDINVPITGGSYSVGTDGRTTISLIETADTTLGDAGTLTFRAVLASSSKALITQFDDTATSSGNMDKQTAVNDLAKGFAFVVNGNDFTFFTAIGGVFNVDSPGVISGAGSVGDIDEGGTVTNTLAGSLTGTVSAVADDPLGSVTVNLSFFDGTTTTDTEFIGYIVDDTHIKLIESDGIFGSMVGQAIGQGDATGTFVDNSFFSGTFVFGVSGITGNVATAGLFTASGISTGPGTLTGGVADEDFAGSVITDTFTGAYAVDTSGTGRTPATTTFDTSANGAGPTLIFYLTGSGTSPLVLNDDTFMEGAGIALPQSGPAFDGLYAFNFSAVDTSPTGNEIDGTAQLSADASAGTFTGTANTNATDLSVTPATITPNPDDLALSGTFTADPSFAGRFKVPDLMVGSSGPFATTLYIADPTQGFIIETDDLQVALGIFIAAQE